MKTYTIYGQPTRRNHAKIIFSKTCRGDKYNYSKAKKKYRKTQALKFVLYCILTASSVGNFIGLAISSVMSVGLSFMFRLLVYVYKKLTKKVADFATLAKKIVPYFFVVVTELLLYVFKKLINVLVQFEKFAVALLKRLWYNMVKINEIK